MPDITEIPTGAKIFLILVYVLGLDTWDGRWEDIQTVITGLFFLPSAAKVFLGENFLIGGGVLPYMAFVATFDMMMTGLYSLVTSIL